MKDVNYSPMSDLRGYLTDRKIRKIIENGKTTRDQLLMKVFWVTGGRVSEIVNKPYGITPEDLVPEENVIIMRTLKRKRKKKGVPLPPPERRVVVPSWLMHELVEFAKSTLPNSPIFPISRQRVFQIVREAGAKAGIVKVGKKKLHPHHLRHSHCIAYIRANNTMEGLRKLQQRVGHARIDTTAGYLQFGLEGERKNIEEIFTP